MGPGCVQVFLRMVRHHLEEGDETQRITGATADWPACFTILERTEVFYIIYMAFYCLYVYMYLILIYAIYDLSLCIFVKFIFTVCKYE